MSMKRVTLYTGLLVLAFAAWAPEAQAADIAVQTSDAPSAVFFSAIQDMPIMPGMHELADQTVMFDKPQGRIIETVAEIDSVSKEQVQAYYKETLPQLGWSALEGDNYARGTEHLSLIFEEIEGERFLRVMLTPR